MTIPAVADKSNKPLLPITDPPSPPRNVLVDDVTKSSCKLTWEPPETDNGSPVTGYTVERCEGKSTRWTKVTKDPVTERQLDIADLRAGESYQFHVCAVNAAGASKPSDATAPVVAKDAFDVPGKPGTPEVKETTADLASLEWKAPDSDGGSAITNYVIEMRLSGETKWKVVNKNEMVVETRFTVKDIKWTKEHEFRVTAENKAGLGQPSAPSKPSKYGNFSKKSSAYSI